MCRTQRVWSPVEQGRSCHTLQKGKEKGLPKSHDITMNPGAPAGTLVSGSPGPGAWELGARSQPPASGTLSAISMTTGSNSERSVWGRMRRPLQLVRIITKSGLC